MNKYQRLIFVVALIDALLMILFPPFNDTPISKFAVPSFEGFYPLVTQFGRKPINTELLTMQLMLIGANALAAYLFLAGRSRPDAADGDFSLGIAGFAAANVGVMLLFPPFEPYASLVRGLESSFDSFYFVWGNRSGRPIFVPLLYLELVFVAVNALSVWLLFNTVRRGDSATRDAAQGEAWAGQAPPGAPRNAAGHELGRGADRRRRHDPGYRGPERRRGARRSHG